MWNGINHWKIPKIISYYPEETVAKPLDMCITKNIYNQPIQGRRLRVIAQLIQLHNQERYDNKDISIDYLTNKPMRWVTIVDDLEKIKEYLRGWADKKYTKELV